MAVPVTDGAYHDNLLQRLEHRYLAATDVRAQSGFTGNAARWERGRRVITHPMVRPGTFLDVGCANGHLMETVAAWTAADGVAIEPYGLDLSKSLAELARYRLPRWADRIWAGNVMSWDPPRRFDYVRTELEYVPEGRQAQLLQRIRDDYLTVDGIAILCSYGSAHDPSNRVYDVAELARSLGHQVAGEAESTDDNGEVITRICWISAAAPSLQ